MVRFCDIFNGAAMEERSKSESAVVVVEKKFVCFLTKGVGGVAWLRAQGIP